MNARLAYTGEVAERGFGSYLLGGRLHCPALRRFASPDAVSPFDEGGFNRYAYCAGDPVNRVDPMGTAWWDWMLAGVGLVLAVAGAVASGGALVGAVGAAGGSIVAAMSTSSGVMAAAAAGLDVLSVAVDVGATVALATRNDAMGGVLGWVGIGTAVASFGVAALSRQAAGVGRGRLASKRTGRASSVKEFVLSPSPSPPPSEKLLEPTVRGRVVLARADVPPNAWLRHHPDGTVSVRPNWRAVHDENRYPGAVHYAADAPVSTSDTPWMLGNVARAHPGQDITIYSGAHGEAGGQNWFVSGRRETDPRLLPADIANLDTVPGRVAAGYVGDGVRVRFIDLAELTPESARRMYAEPGIHVHMVCYGLVDELLLSMFNVKPRRVYASWRAS